MERPPRGWFQPVDETLAAVCNAFDNAWANPMWEKIKIQFKLTDKEFKMYFKFTSYGLTVKKGEGTDVMNVTDFIILTKRNNDIEITSIFYDLGSHEINPCLRAIKELERTVLGLVNDMINVAETAWNMHKFAFTEGWVGTALNVDKTAYQINSKDLQNGVRLALQIVRVIANFSMAGILQLFPPEQWFLKMAYLSVGQRFLKGGIPEPTTAAEWVHLYTPVADLGYYGMILQRLVSYQDAVDSIVANQALKVIISLTDGKPAKKGTAKKAQKAPRQKKLSLQAAYDSFCEQAKPKGIMPKLLGWSDQNVKAWNGIRRRVKDSAAGFYKMAITYGTNETADKPGTLFERRWGFGDLKSAFTDVAASF